MTAARVLFLAGIPSFDLTRDLLVHGLRLTYPDMQIMFDHSPMIAAQTWNVERSSGWEYHAACGFKSDDFSLRFSPPDLVVCSEGSLDGLMNERGQEWLRELLLPYRGRIVSFNGADHPLPPAQENPVLRDFCALRFVSQLPVLSGPGTRWGVPDQRCRALPPGVCIERLPLVREAQPRPLGVLWGGQYQRGHGGRWELLAPSIEAGLIDTLVRGLPGWDYLSLLGRSKAAIAIGCAGNHPEAGLNMKHLEAVCMGAACFSFPPGVQVPALFSGIEFTTSDELIELCRAVSDLPPPSDDLVRAIRKAHSLQARARSFVAACDEMGMAGGKTA